LAKLEEILRVNEFLEDPLDITPERLRKLSNTTLGTNNRASSLLLNRSNTSAFSTPSGGDTFAGLVGADDNLLNEFSFFFNEKNDSNGIAKKGVPLESLLHPIISRESSTTIPASATEKGQKPKKRCKNMLVFDEDIMLDRNQMFKELQAPPLKRKKRDTKMEEMRRM
jgi:hypothetical protein